MSKFRLVTRSDFDGLVCAVLLKHLNMIDEIKFVHPKDMQDGKIAIGPNDITTNLPYVPGAHLVFDHHSSETARSKPGASSNYVIDPNAASAARVVYDHFGGRKAFPADDWCRRSTRTDRSSISRTLSRHRLLQRRPVMVLL